MCMYVAVVLCSQSHLTSDLVSFRFVSFRFVSFRFVSFRFVPCCAALRCRRLGVWSLQLMEKLAAACATEVGKSYGSFTIAAADEFSYTDPETQEVAEKQGTRFMAEDGSRFVFRLSGTSSTNGEERSMPVHCHQTDSERMQCSTVQPTGLHLPVITCVLPTSSGP
jgi:hypothetical protein